MRWSLIALVNTEVRSNEQVKSYISILTILAFLQRLHGHGRLLTLRYSHGVRTVTLRRRWSRYNTFGRFQLMATHSVNFLGAKLL